MRARRRLSKKTRLSLDVALAAVAAMCVSSFLQLIIRIYWGVRVIEVADGLVYHFSALPVGVVAGVGLLLVVLGLRLGLERQYHNWLLVALGAGFLLVGTTYVAGQRVIVDVNGFEIRGWWGLSGRRWNFNDLSQLHWVHHYSSFRRRSHWQSVECVTKEGRRLQILNDRYDNSLFRIAEPDIMNKASASGVQIHRESERR